MFYEVLVSKVFRKSAKLEDGILVYTFNEVLQPGTIVSVPLGKSEVAGIIYKKVPDPHAKFAIKSISRILYNNPIPSHLLKSIIWISKYYLTPIPQAVNLALPSGIFKNRRSKLTAVATNVTTTDIPFNTTQKKAYKSLSEKSSNTKLLHGITGSGKTNIYLKLTLEQFDQKKSTILLVPEIALTSQLVKIFESTFGDSVILIHSKQTESERHQIWEKNLNSNKPLIIIGPRSALFAPIHNLGLIIIDEAHESTYFQEQPPKYNALRLASFIAKNADISCVYGTATPLVSDYYLAKENDSYVELKQKAKDTAINPNIEIIDFKSRANFSRNRYFSDQLLSKIKHNLENHQQTLIFHNRRGSAPLTICENCGWQALCPACFLPLTLHTDTYSLICHTCGYTGKIPSKCPECNHLDIIHKGFGTKLLESELKKLFKEARIARFDTDNDKDSSLEKLYSEVKDGNIDIIIGTQAVARGFDFPKLATVGIAQADAGLSLPDYSSEERTFHLLTQVLGRVGRGHLDEANAVIQTFQPEHPVIQAAIKNDYDSFSDFLLQKRKKSHLPPFFFMAKLSMVYKTEQTTIKKIKQVYKELKNIDGLIVSQPTPSFHERTPSGYSWQIIIKSRSRNKITETIKNLNSYADLHFTLDPPSLL